MHSTSIYSCQSEKDVRVKELDQQPLDSIQCIYWDRNEGCRFIVGGWDGVLRFYSMNFSPMFLEQNYCTFLEEPILCCTMDRSYLAYTGHSDGFIRATNIPTNQTVVFGKHEGAAVKDVYWVEQMNCLLSLGFDNKLHFWQPGNPAPVMTVTLPYKTFCSSLDYPYLLICSNDQKYSVLRIDNPSTISPPKYLDSPLGLHSKLISADINASAKSWLICSADGRANYGSFYDTSTGVDCSNSVVCFKAQKRQDYIKNLYYMVNSCGFNPRKPDTIFVAGGEQSLTFFTAQKNGDRIKMYKFKAPVTAARLSPNGNYMAYALGNDWTQGLNGMGKFDPKIVVHVMLEEDSIKKTGTI